MPDAPACWTCGRELRSLDPDRHVAPHLVCERCASAVRRADELGEVDGYEDHEWLLLRCEELLTRRRFQAARNRLWLRGQLASMRR